MWLIPTITKICDSDSKGKEYEEEDKQKHAYNEF